MSTNLENKAFMKEIGIFLALRKHSWEPSLYDHRGHCMFYEDFMDLKRRSKYGCVTVPWGTFPHVSPSRSLPMSTRSTPHHLPHPAR